MASCAEADGLAVEGDGDDGPDPGRVGGLADSVVEGDEGVLPGLLEDREEFILIQIKLPFYGGVPLGVGLVGGSSTLQRATL